MSFIRDLLSESPTASFGRFATLLCIVFVLGWDSASLFFVLRHWSELHLTISDAWVPAATLTGQGAFCLLFYGTNKLAATIPNNGK